MNEMIERIAQALAVTYSRFASGKKAENEIVVTADREAARAVIEALREPTETMADAAWDYAHTLSAANRVLVAPPESTWRAMIDAALTEKQPSKQ